MRHPPTGDGPPPSPLTPAEEAFVQVHGDDPAVVGIDRMESEVLGKIFNI